MVECPNKHHLGIELVQLKKPAWVLIDTDVMDYFPDDVRKEVTVCTLIHQVCPECGFTVSEKLNMEEWSKFLKSLKKTW